MACPHYQISIVKRSAGQSAVAAAAYQSGASLYSEHDQKRKSYSEKQGIVHTEIMLCAHSPPAFADRNTLWNAVAKAETQWNAQLARKIVLALPTEVPKSEYPKMLRDYCAEHFVSKGMCADIAIHDKGDGNPHAHIMLTMRSMGEDGSFLPKARKEYVLDENGERIRLPSGEWKTRRVSTNDWNEQSNAEAWRQGWADVQNQYLERHCPSVQVDLRSYARQGTDQIPTVHMGPAAWAMEKKGIQTELGNLNCEIMQHNSLIRRIAAAIRKLRTWIQELKAEREQIENEPTLYEKLQRYLDVRRAERTGWSSHAQLTGTVNDFNRLQSVVYFMREKNIVTVSDFEATLDAQEQTATRLREAVRANESRIRFVEKVSQTHSRYNELRPVHLQYQKLMFKRSKEKFFTEHKAELEEYSRSLRFLLKNGGTLRDHRLVFDSTGCYPEKLALGRENHELEKQLLVVESDLRQLRQIRYYIEHGAAVIDTTPVFRKSELQKTVDEFEKKQAQTKKHTRTQAEL